LSRGSIIKPPSLVPCVMLLGKKLECGFLEDEEPVPTRLDFDSVNNEDPLVASMLDFLAEVDKTPIMQKTKTQKKGGNYHRRFYFTRFRYNER